MRIGYFSLAPALFILVLTPHTATSQTAPAARTVIDNEVGSIFTWPVASSGFTWQETGAIVNVSQFFRDFTNLNPQTIKVIHARFHVFKPSDDRSWSWFPYSAFRAYEAKEVAAGRPPLFVTATYQGKRRPVLWAWSLGLNGKTPTAPSSEWRYAVNVQDERFIQFWIQRYVREVLYAGLSNVQNLWVGLDECAFMKDLYGVLDDNNQFVSGGTWDQPFPQDESQYLNSINTFFTRVKALAPDVKLMANSGGLKDWKQFSHAFAAPGIMVEEYNWVVNAANVTYSPYTRNEQLNQITEYSNAASNGKVMIMQTYVPANDPVKIRSAYGMYFLMKGPNTFFAPTIAGTSSPIPLASYSGLTSALGNPTGPVQSVQNTTTPSYWPGYRLYWRQFDGGIVYSNWTGSTRTIPLPTGSLYFDLNGNPITQITVPDLTAGYALYAKSGLNRQAMPRVNPRYAVPVAGPLAVNITNPDSSTTPIYYTLNGGSTAIVNGPLSVMANTQVAAEASDLTKGKSWSSRALYTVNLGSPVVRFAAADDSGPSGTYYVLLCLNSISTKPVSVNYYVQPASGAPVYGSITFNPGDQFRNFPISTAPGVTQVSIWGPNGSIIGAPYLFRYTAR